jgi:hypothetical protein
MGSTTARRATGREAHVKRSLTVLALAWAVVFGCGRPAHAQLKGHYIPGFAGMQNGSQAPPGISLFAPAFFFTTDTLKNDEGDALGAHPRTDSGGEPATNAFALQPARIAITLLYPK